MDAETAPQINDKAGIRQTFAACKHLTEVHILPNGARYFTKGHAEVVLGEGDVLVTLRPDSEHLKEEAAKPAK